MSAQNRISKIIFIFFSLIGVSSTLLHLTAVSVKAEFGTGGIVTTRIGNNDQANAVVIQPDGKIVAAGHTDEAQFALVRYNPDGSLDTTFGAGGIVTTLINGQAYALAIQPDGKLVAAGRAYNGSEYVFALARYNTDGSLDTSFSEDGKTITFVGQAAYVSTAYALALQSDGKIVAAGRAGGTAGGDTFALVRYNSDGSLDTTFGSNGTVTTNIGSGEYVHGLQIQPDGKLVAAGYADIANDRRFTLARYNSNGTLDTSFGTGGIVTTAIGNFAEGYSLAIQPDGKLLVTGRFRVQDDNIALVRYNTDGSLDTSFSGGIVTTSIGRGCLPYTLAIQPDGNILAGGSCYGYPLKFAVVRFNSSGSLDTSFGVGGFVTTPIDHSDNHSNITALKIQPDGKVIAVGYANYTDTCCAGPYEFALVRYNTDGSLDTGAMVTQPPSADSLTPVNISTWPGIVAQAFTAVYSDPDGWSNLSDVSLFLSGRTHNEWMHYNPQTNKFTLLGASGDCSPGQATTISNGYLTLNCGTSSASGSGNTLTVTYNLTPQPPLSGKAYRLIIAVSDQGGASNNKDMGYWAVNRPPHASCIPGFSSTPVGTSQTWTCAYSDPDGYQNIAEANFYLAGGMHNEWLHYISAANIFFIMGTNDVCSPGEMKMLSNGYLTLDCATSSVLGSGNTLTVTFRVTPLGPSLGLNYNIFLGVSDHVGAAKGLFGGTWQIQ